MRERTGTYWVLVGKPEGKRQPANPSGRWGDNITMHLEELLWERGLG